ncbi:MAG TPA: hypothetical protein VLA23_10145 [Candidatus Limnocylindrales bacterium]|nr:hypothetical protein [Candidatus Limnocylindrales bacterium]
MAEPRQGTPATSRRRPLPADLAGPLGAFLLIVLLTLIGPAVVLLVKNLPS